MTNHNVDTDLLYRLWGKTNEREKGGKDASWSYHPAICHMVDVGYVAEVWLETSPTILDRFCTLAPGIDRDELKRIIVTIAALHDLGKVHRRFQAKSEKGWMAGYGAEGTERIADHAGFDHGLATAHIMRDLMRGPMKGWSSWRNAIEAVAAHHGRFYSNNDLDSGRAASAFGLNNIDRPSALAGVNMISRLFQLPEPLPAAPACAAFNMLLAGFVSVSDWFGSNSEVFTFARISSEGDACAYLEQLRREGRAESQLRDAGLIGAFRRDDLGYGDIFSFLDHEEKLRPMQRLSRELSFGVESGPEMAIVEAPMGMGKTEIALYLAAQAIRHGNAEGLYFALPTQASSNALFDRIYSFTERIKRQDAPIGLAVAHGGKRYFGKYQALRQKTWKESQAGPQRVVEQLERARADRGPYRDTVAPPSEVIAPDWLQSSKRTLLASMGIGTIDQAMLGAITVRHAFVRLFALSGKVVVFDEIHAYDSYMNVVIEHLLRWLHALGAKVILLSATLPRGLRSSFLSTFAPSATEPPIDQNANTADNPEGDPYPQMLHLTADNRLVMLSPKEGHSPSDSVPTRIELHQVDNDSRTLDGVRLALDLAANGGCIAWIRNTVREAQEAWGMIMERIRGVEPADQPSIALLHARFTRNDRSKIEQVLVEILGKDGGADRPRRMIVIATQVIEQSIDIDFDAMISDLAPVDLLLQRSGRLWRHERPNEQRHRHTEPVLHILAPDEEQVREMDFGSSSYVYDDEVLARSLWLLQHDSTWTMPASCRRLVAGLYDHPATEWTADRLGVAPENLNASRHKQQRLLDDMKGTARRILMPAPSARSLTMLNAFNDDDRGDSVALTTRYGGASATLVLLQRRSGRLACVGGDEPLPDPLPNAESIGKALKVDEAVILSAVSFPWYGELRRQTSEDEDVAALDTWWRDRHPYDNKQFVLLDDNHVFDHPQFAGRYRRDGSGNAVEGLVIERQRNAEQSDTISYEDL